MFCPECGAPVNEEHEFCPKCGTKLDMSDGTFTPANARTQQAVSPVSHDGGAHDSSPHSSAAGAATA